MIGKALAPAVLLAVSGLMPGGCGNCCESEKGADSVAAKKSGDPLMECGTQPDAKAVTGATGGAKVVKSEEEWRKTLTPEQFTVLRQKGTERPFQGPYWDFHEKDGTFRCAGCGNVLFTADAKFDSGTGWPSFSSPAAKDGVKTHTDTSHGMTRTEVVCAKCDGHLGHVFNDGPGPGGLRYCINGTALKLEKKAEGK